jgi:hypothetical protein
VEAGRPCASINFLLSRLCAERLVAASVDRDRAHANAYEPAWIELSD